MTSKKIKRNQKNSSVKVGLSKKKLIIVIDVDGLKNDIGGFSVPSVPTVYGGKYDINLNYNLDDAIDFPSYFH